MAGILTVQTIQGPTSGANANKVIIPAGQTLDASAGSVTLPAGAGGKVLQVVQTIDTTNRSGTSGAEAYTGLSASITPTSATSKVLVLFQVAGGFTDNNNAAGSFLLRRGTTTGSSLISKARCGGYANNASVESYAFYTIIGLDSPASTSSVTYGLFAANISSEPLWVINANSGQSNIVLMEIAQ